MRLPRDLSGEELVKRLQDFGYQATRQRGSHIRVTTQQNGEHHITVPRRGLGRYRASCRTSRIISD